MTREYVITGSTGALGSAIVRQLAATSSCRLKLLLRANSDEELMGKRQSLLEWAGIPVENENIVAVAADMALPRFGWQEPEWFSHAASATHVIHSAGNVSLTLPDSVAWEETRTSTENILDFAKAVPRLEKLEFVSTIGVGGISNEPVPEDWLIGQSHFHNSYERAKARAEGLVQEAADSGLAVTVHRPSMIVGSSVNGAIIKFQVFYHICEFLTGLRTKGIVPSLEDRYLDIVPVDFVSNGIIWSSQTQKTIGRVMHLCSGRNSSLNLGQLTHDLPGIYHRFGFDVPVPIVLQRKLFSRLMKVVGLFAGAKTRRAIKTFPHFLKYVNQDQIFEVEETHSMLRHADIELPLMQHYLPKVFEYYLERRRS